MGKDPTTDMCATILATVLSDASARWPQIEHAVIKAHGDFPDRTIRYNLNKLIRTGLVRRVERGVYAIGEDISICDGSCGRTQPHPTGWCEP